MMYYDFNAGGKAYKLRLTTRDIVSLEKQLGCNPISIFGKGDTIPTITAMVNVLHASLQSFHHGISLNDAYTIFDEWLEDDHAMAEFVLVIMEIYKVSGIIKNEAEKN